MWINNSDPQNPSWDNRGENRGIRNMIPGVCSLPFSFLVFFFFPPLQVSWNLGHWDIYIYMYRIPACVLLQNIYSSTSSRWRWNLGAEIHFHYSDRDTLQCCRYELKLLHEMNGVQVGVKLKLLFTRPVCIQQNTTCCLDLHCFDDPIEVVLVSVSTGVNNPISCNRPLLSDWAKVEWP